MPIAYLNNGDSGLVARGIINQLVAAVNAGGGGITGTIATPRIPYATGANTVANSSLSYVSGNIRNTGKYESTDTHSSVNIQNGSVLLKYDNATDVNQLTATAAGVYLDTTDGTNIATAYLSPTNYNVTAGSGSLQNVANNGYFYWDDVSVSAYFNDGIHGGSLTIDTTHSYLTHDVKIELDAPSVKKNGVEVATLADIPSVAGFVPYTGATSNLDMGTNQVYAGLFQVGTTGGGEYVSFRKQTSIATGSATSTYSKLMAGTSGEMLWKYGTTYATLVTTGITANRAYTFQDASGTLAFLTDVPSAATQVQTDAGTSTTTWISPSTLANAATVVHRTGNETVAGDKSFTGATTIGGNISFTGTVNSSLTGANARIPSHTNAKITFTNASLTSIASANNGGVSDGHTLILTNATGAAITIVNNYGSAAAGEAIYTGSAADVSIPNKSSFWLIWDTTSNGWLCISSGLLKTVGGVSILGTGDISAPDFSTSITGSYATASTIAYFDASKNIKSIASVNTAVLTTNGSGIPSLTAQGTAFNKAFGTLAGTVTEGNDIRLTDESLLTYAALGSSIIAQTVGVNMRQIATGLNMASQTIYVVPVYLKVAQTITGIKWYQNTKGSYTANNENRIGIYTYSGGTITLVASTTNDGNLWQTAANTTYGSKALSSPYSASAGLYFVALLYSSSAQTTAPQIGVGSATLGSVVIGDFTNSAKLFSAQTSITALPSSQAMSGLTVLTSTPWVGLY